MKALSGLPMLLAWAAPLIASCQSIAPAAPAPAVLTGADAQCRAQLDAAAAELTGRPIMLADDAFAKTDSVVLATVGQSASGRMPPPTMILQLGKTEQGCRLQFKGREQTVMLAACKCIVLTEIRTEMRTEMLAEKRTEKEPEKNK
jgi:hypothetical protein